MDTRVSHCLRAEMRLCLKNEEVEYADLRTPPNPLSYCLYFILFSCRAAFSLIQLHGGKKCHQPNFLSLPLLYLKFQIKLEFFGLNFKGLGSLLGQVPRHPLSILWSGRWNHSAQI